MRTFTPGTPTLGFQFSSRLVSGMIAATRRPGVTRHALIKQALEEFFEPAIRYGLEENLLRRLDGFDIRQGEIERDLALCLETLGQFVRYWLTRTGPIAKGERDLARSLGQRRFEYFIDQVARKVRGGGASERRFGLVVGAQPTLKDTQWPERTDSAAD